MELTEFNSRFLWRACDDEERLPSAAAKVFGVACACTRIVPRARLFVPRGPCPREARFTYLLSRPALCGTSLFFFVVFFGALLPPSARQARGIHRELSGWGFFFGGPAFLLGGATAFCYEPCAKVPRGVGERIRARSRRASRVGAGAGERLEPGLEPAGVI